MSVKWIDYKDKKLLYSDYRGLITDGQMIANITEVCRIIGETEGEVLLLEDYSKTLMSSLFYEAAFILVPPVISKIKKHALLGFSRKKKLHLHEYNEHTGDCAIAFDNEESAKEYLIS